MPKPRLPRLVGVSAVWGLAAVVFASALALYAAFVPRLPTLGGPIRIPWYVLAVMFCLTEIFVVHLHFRRDAHSFSLSEIPLVLGLFFASPAALVLAQLAGAGAALTLYSRQSLLKTILNLGSFFLGVVLAVIVFHALVPEESPVGAMAWGATLLATLLTMVAAALIISLAISLSEGEVHLHELPQVLGLGATVTLANTSLAIIGATILWREATAVWLLLVPAVILFFAYRAYSSERQQHASLESLYEITGILQRSRAIEETILALLREARKMFRAERAEVILLPSSRDASATRTVLGPDDHVEVMHPVDIDPSDGAWGRILQDRKAVLLSKPIDDHNVRDYFTARQIEDAMMAPLQGETGVMGLMMVANRLGEVTTFDNEDVKLFETLANHASVSLESASLSENLRQNEERFRSLVQNSSDVITIIDVDTTIRYQSPSVAHVLGWDQQELVGRKLIDLVHPDDAARVLAFYEEATNREGVTPSVEWRMRHRSGSWLYVEVISNNLLTDPNVRGFVLNTRDLSDRKELEEQLTHQAFHDSLTQLANRALFADRVKHALARLDRHHEPVAVLFMDLDDFKTVNDSLGHAAGDQLLVSVAGRLRASLRPHDTVARLGGDEFAILLEDARDRSDAVNVAARIMESLKAPFVLEGKEVFVRASIGIANSASSADEAEELLRNADVAMYVAKGHGKSRYEVFEPSMHTAALQRLELKGHLQRAVENGEFTLCYQPIVELHDGAIVGVEALVRWKHPDRGMVPPGEFISLAEETGLILPLGRWVLRESCRQARLWQTMYPQDEPLKMSVNLSARQLQHPDLVAEIAEMIGEFRLDPPTLTLEITESVLMNDTEAAIRKLEDLKQLGVLLAIDDFGTGYSSLSYLERFPIDILKIDKSFVDGIGREAEESALARAIVRLGGTLGLETIAEGIEYEEQRDELRAMRCDLGQGYLFARPLQRDEVEVLLGRAHAARHGVTPVPSLA